MMQKTYLETTSSDPSYEQTRKDVSSDDVLNWFDIESNGDVQMALIDDAVMCMSVQTYRKVSQKVSQMIHSNCNQRI